MDRYVCIHGHFYQPPRENAWLEAIELQDSAYPYHDWNERVTAECYETNTASRILAGDGRIVRIVNTYAQMSFNFGPTLMAWLQDEAPHVHAAVLDADRESSERFSGHGSALALAYNHIIMPLANPHDKRTQVMWGIRDFQRRFGRLPEGMWLPEAAADVATLEALADAGLRFTILAPHQARRIRKLGDRRWQDVSGARIDPTRAYRARLPSGRDLALFFYDGPVSRAVAFEGLLSSGETFAHRVNNIFAGERDWPQLAHIATDGESYGHHHRHGDMALAYALDYIEREGLARLTNYGEYLERFPPTHEVEIIEGTSWSCAHGVERWRSNCGCNSGGRPGWNQEWRGPLRAALDWLRDATALRFEESGRELFRDPWAARDDYIDVILDRSPKSVAAFLAQHATRQLSDGERVRALKLMELQRHALLMYTSCGWFFDDLSGPETVQVIQYAGRAIQLSDDLFGDQTEERFLDRLAQARSNLEEHGDGRRVYEKFVRPAMIDLLRAGAHYAVSSLFEEYAEGTSLFAFRVDREDYHHVEAGESRLALGRIHIASTITTESAALAFGVLHFGGHNIIGGVREFRAGEPYATMVRDVSEEFAGGDLAAVIRTLDRHFLELPFSLKSLFRDEQRRILNLVLASALSEAEVTYRGLYEHHAPLMRFLTDVGFPLPAAFLAAAELTLNGYIRRALQEDVPQLEHVQAHLDDVSASHLNLDKEGLAFVLRGSVNRLVDRFEEEPSDLQRLEALQSVVELARTMPFEVDLWRAQNVYYNMLHKLYPQYRARSDLEGAEWLARFVALGERLAVRVE